MQPRWRGYSRFFLALGLLVAQGAGTASLAVQTPLNARRVPQFVEPLPVLGAGIPVTFGTPNGVTGNADVTLSICEFKTNILPAGTLGAGTPAPATSVWGYRIGDVCPGQNTVVTDSYIGPVIVATRGTPTAVTYKNQLGDATTTNVLAYKDSTDQSVMWADPLGFLGGGLAEANFCNEALMTLPAGSPPPAGCEAHYLGPVPTAPHLHGGEIPAMLDGGPDAWWTGGGTFPYGHGYYSQGGFADAALGQATYVYPNVQEAAPLWFHDHVLGATRLNVYAGIAGAYMLVDPALALAPGLLPLGMDTNGDGTLQNPDGSFQASELLVPLVLQDRMFDTTGQLYFPAAGINPEHPYWVPEFVGDTIAVNGKAWPYLDVEPKRYRFLILNGSNARAYELFTINPATGFKAPRMWVIATDQGYLEKRVRIDPRYPADNKLVIMPGERYEVIIDFAGLPPGTTIELRNTARTPYPAGPDPARVRTTMKILQFRVGAAPLGFTDLSYNPAIRPRVKRDLVRLANPATGALATTAGGQPITVHKVRRLTLNESIAAGGPMEIVVNNTDYLGNLNPTGAGPRTDFTPITTQWNTTYYSELPHEGETELWEIVNISADAHPVHPHLVGVQILNRQAIDAVAYTAAYDGSFPGGGLDLAALPVPAPYPAGVYMPGYGPPLDYNCGNPANAARGILDPATCVLGGNPDPAPFFLGAARPPRPWEAGWKDTAISFPGEVLRLLVRFAPAGLPNDTLSDAAVASYEFDPNGGHGYVWHCHIIDHEDNEMMRPYSVVANPSANPRTFVQGVNF